MWPSVYFAKVTVALRLKLLPTPVLNPLQFAYRAGRGVEDVTVTLQFWGLLREVSFLPFFTFFTLMIVVVNVITGLF